MSTRLVSNYSTYWPIYGLKKNCMDFTIDRLNPYATTPPQVIRTLPTSHELQLARQNQLHRCAPFVDAVTHVDMLCVLMFIVFMVLMSEGGVLRFHLKPAGSRTVYISMMAYIRKVLLVNDSIRNLRTINDGLRSLFIIMIWYGFGRPVTTSEIGNWCVFVSVRMAFCIRDNHEMRRARAPHRQMSSRLWWINKAAFLSSKSARFSAKVSNHQGLS